MKTASLLGLLLIGVGAYAYIALPARSDWPALILMLAGAHLVSRRELSAALRSLAKYLPGLK